MCVNSREKQICEWDWNLIAVSDAEAKFKELTSSISPQFFTAIQKILNSQEFARFSY